MGTLEQGTSATRPVLQTSRVKKPVRLAGCNNESKEVSYTSFIDNDLNSLTWYDILPGDGFSITAVDDPRSAAEIAQFLIHAELQENLDGIDLLAAKVLNGCYSISAFGEWGELAFRLSRVMAQNLHAGGNRDLRMRAQRLNYFLRVMLDESVESANIDLLIAETRLEGSKIWDFMPDVGGDWWLSSDEKKIRYRRTDGQQQFWNIGLPTQIDMLPDGSLCFGSIYTEGALLRQNGEWLEVKHERPVVLIFEHASQRFLLDHDGRLWLDHPKRIYLDSGRPQVHFARYYDGRLFLLDNSDFGHITIINLNSNRITRQTVFPVLVCNDLVKSGQNYFLIDKQQGNVFKFDRDWKCLDHALKFGRGRGCLLDPVAIHECEDRLLIVSWLSARLTELRMF